MFPRSRVSDTVDDFTRNYLGYLRDCARLVSKDSPVDFRARTTRGDICLLSAAETRQIEASQSLQTDSPVLMKWRRELEISAEGECSILFGFLILAGRHEQSRMCCPLVIAEAEVSTEGDNETRVELKPGTMRLYTPALSMLLTEGENTDPEVVAAEVEKIAKETPYRFPFGSEQEKLIRSIRNSVKEERRAPFSQPIVQMKGIEESELRAARDGTRLALLSTVVLLKVDALPDFSVEKEISDIIKDEMADGTGIPLIVRQVGKVGKSSQFGDEPEKQLPETDHVLEVLTLSEEQRLAVAYAKRSALTVVSGPPGTGKSHTIASLAINLAYAGKTVLISSKTREAVSVVVDKLSGLGGKYVVAHVGDKSQKREFANLIKGILEYERLDRKLEASALESAKAAVARARRDKSDVARAIRQLEGFYAQFHTARAALDRLADVEIPDVTPSIRELESLKQNASWINGALSRPIPSFAQKLRSRVLMNQISSRLHLQGRRGYRAVVDAADKAFHTKKAEEALGVLKNQKNIRTLWRAHADAVKAELAESGKLFECWRKKALAELLLTDRENTPKLRNYANALEAPVTNASKARLISKILEGTDSSLLLRCFPIWACTSSHLSQALKLDPALFDYVILDEASLCDPATAIPALYRARRVIVVGDEKQLKHRSQNIAEPKLQMLATKNGLDALTINDLNYRRSVYEIAASRVAKEGLFMLDEHFRSLPPIVGFSNAKYYENRLKVMRRNPMNEKATSVEFRYVPGRRNDLDVIPEEYDEALEIVADIIHRQPRVSLGVITMTEAQARYMNARFAEESIVGTLINHCRFKCGTPQSFQGDQRHTIILCLGVDPDAHQRSLQHALDDNRFNVAVTRAEDRMIVVSSIPQSDFLGNIREYYEHATGVHSASPSNKEPDFGSNFERQVYETLIAEKLNVHSQYESCGYFIDFVITKGDRFIALEVDGPQHFDDQGNYVPRDVERSLRLTRGGWHIERISCYEWEKGLPARREFVARIMDALSARSSR
jgi:very-short-patch-repair endonuclease